MSKSKSIITLKKLGLIDFELILSWVFIDYLCFFYGNFLNIGCCIKSGQALVPLLWLFNNVKRWKFFGSKFWKYLNPTPKKFVTTFLFLKTGPQTTLVRTYFWTQYFLQKFIWFQKTYGFKTHSSYCFLDATLLFFSFFEQNNDLFLSKFQLRVWESWFSLE